MNVLRRKAPKFQVVAQLDERDAEIFEEAARDLGAHSQAATVRALISFYADKRERIVKP